MSARPTERARRVGREEARVAPAALAAPEARPRAAARELLAAAAGHPRSGSRTAAATAAGRLRAAVMAGPCTRMGSAATAGPSAPRAPRRPASLPSAAAAGSVGPTRPARPRPATHRARRAACPASRARGIASQVIGEPRCAAEVQSVSEASRCNRNRLSWKSFCALLFHPCRTPPHFETPNSHTPRTPLNSRTTGAHNSTAALYLRRGTASPPRSCARSTSLGSSFCFCWHSRLQKARRPSLPPVAQRPWKWP